MAADGFLQRAAALPRLGLGLSTEYGASRADGALDPNALRRAHPELVRFLEVGVEIAKGLDDDARVWAESGAPTTYHFLDINLDDPEDFDDAWLADVRACAATLRPAWLCGDAGLWHFGARDRGQMLLLPPVLELEAVGPMAAGIVRLREAIGLEVLPENPPCTHFVGRMHLLEFFAAVAEQADTGLLVDCAHLGMFQRIRGHGLLDGFDALPWDRVIEVHVAGGRERSHDGYAWVDDDHGPVVLDDTWTLLDEVLARASNLRALVVECERNPLPRAAAMLREVGERWR